MQVPEKIREDEGTDDQYIPRESNERVEELTTRAHVRHQDVYVKYQLIHTQSAVTSSIQQVMKCSKCARVHVRRVTTLTSTVILVPHQVTQKGSGLEH